MSTILQVKHLKKIYTTRFGGNKVEALRSRYTPQIASRIEGEYQILPFFGEDIRRLKREQQR